MAKPFLKWTGGKSRLLPHILPLAARGYKHYFEPMVGGGGIFFGLEPKVASLSDSNEELMTTYHVVRDYFLDLLHKLDNLQKQHREYGRDHYDSVRARSPTFMNDLDLAARFIYLNRTCYNGLYRVNANGEFNVPMGRYDKPNICNDKVLLAASKALEHTTLDPGDVVQALSFTGQGSFVYIDPPYVPVSATSNFTSFTVDGFTNEDHVRLRNAALAAYQRGAMVVLSNSDTPFVRELYKTFQMKVIPAARRIYCKGRKRGIQVP